MKKQITITTLALAALALTACGSSAESDEPVEVTPVTPEAVNVQPVESETPEAEAEDELTERGNHAAEVGGTGILADANGNETVKFTVKGIEPVKCTEPYAEKAENGHIFAVEMSIKTTKDMEPYSAMFSGHQWTYYNDEGTRFNGELSTIATYSCLPDSEVIPSDIGPGEKATGVVLIDVPAKSGVLVFEPDYFNGYEYKF
jgi:hypothetical protein